MVDQKTYLSPGISDVVIKRLRQRLELYRRFGLFGVDRQEREVLQLMAEGKTTNQIADCLCVSVKTVNRTASRS